MCSLNLSPILLPIAPPRLCCICWQSKMAYNFTVRTRQDLIDAVQEYGIVPYFSTSIPGFSLEEHCPPAVLFSDTGEDTWAWKGPVIRATGCAYGKFFEKKSAYVSREVFLDLANYRRDGYDFDAPTHPSCPRNCAERADMPTAEDGRRRKGPKGSTLPLPDCRNSAM